MKRNITNKELLEEIQKLRKEVEEIKNQRPVVITQPYPVPIPYPYYPYPNYPYPYYPPYPYYVVGPYFNTSGTLQIESNIKYV